ncbi:MAG: tyrosine protein phosphatase [Candidatus Omnitrophica bacterium]|nr:tyrosine protein phosphatase [Candidatus Omnitrophota bacterium]
MIDIHCHILPDIDDGPRTMEESLEMCRIAVADGIKTIVATPHHNSPYVDSQPTAVVLQRVEELREELCRHAIPLEILPGQEIHITETIVEDILQGRSLTLNNAGRYALIEMPSDSVPFYVRQVVEELKENGITAIIAHPERNRQVQQDPDALGQLIDAGALGQITAGSMLGQFGSSAETTSRELLKNGHAQVIASDAHSPRRPPELAEALRTAEGIKGDILQVLDLELIKMC